LRFEENPTLCYLRILIGLYEGSQLSLFAKISSYYRHFNVISTSLYLHSVSKEACVNTVALQECRLVAYSPYIYLFIIKFGQSHSINFKYYPIKYQNYSLITNMEANFLKEIRRIGEVY
jgi:hypothetical protein